MTATRLNINAGGVCDNCGLPALAHARDTCPPPGDDGGPRVKAWLAIVQPHQDAYQRARKYARNQRRHLRQGRVTGAFCEAAERRRDELLIDYRAAIRRADLSATP